MSRILCLAVTSPASVNGLLGAQLPGLVAADWDVHVVCAPGQVDAHHKRSVTVHQVPMTRTISPGADLTAVVRFIGLLRRVRPDILVGGTPKAATVSMLHERAASPVYLASVPDSWCPLGWHGWTQVSVAGCC